MALAEPDDGESAPSICTTPFPGLIGEAFWQSPLKQLPNPPWAPLRGFTSLFFGKARTGWRVLWVFGGARGNECTNAIWRSNDGGNSWEKVEGVQRWSPRMRAGIAAGSTVPHPNPKAIVYVVGGQAMSGLRADVWASDTLCRTWHRMNENAPFGARVDAACATVPGNPCSLVVGGGVSSDVHRDLWLSRDIGETFSKVDFPDLPPFATLVQWPPDLLCASWCSGGRALGLWHVRLRGGDAGGDAGGHADRNSLEPLSDIEEPGDTLNSLRRPPRVSLDLQAQVALWWDSGASCLAAQSLSAGSRAVLLREVAGPPGDADVLCDMDSPYASLRRGRIWLLPTAGSGVWASDRARYKAQERFLRLLGVRLQDKLGMPIDVWNGRVRAMLLPGPRRVFLGGAPASLKPGM